MPNANQAARLIDAGSTIMHNAQEMDDKITKALSYHFCALRFWITYVPRIASRIAIKPPYGPGLAKLPVITKPACPDNRKPRNCKIPRDDSPRARKLNMTIKVRNPILFSLNYFNIILALRLANLIIHYNARYS